MELWEVWEWVVEEIRQRRDEGADVGAWEAERERLAAECPDDASAWAAFRGRLMDAPCAPDGDGREPSTLPEIRRLRAAGPRRLPIEAAALPDKMLGAWQGRIAGCILGKPVEGKSKAHVDRYLRAAGMDDLTTYLPPIEPWPETVEGEPFGEHPFPGCMEGRITVAERDDDIDYTILALHIVETHGPGFTADNVAEAWLNLLPYNQVYTAERVAYRNLVNGLRPPHTATHQNPYREWIGAQIRADGFGYIAAGDPERAAGYGFRDASVSHVRNGIYGEMWAAAMIASAFSVSSPREAIEVGLSEIPAESRLAQAGRKVLAWSRELPAWEACWARVREDYSDLHWVHTINNACWVMLGLLYGEGDFGKTISIAVRCGDDTDCNGATAGSVIGAILGAKDIPSRWTAPFGDRLRSYVLGFDHSRITDLAARTLRQHERASHAI